MRRAPTIKLDIPGRKELERLSRSRSVAVRLARTISNCLAGRRGSGAIRRSLPSWTSLVKRPDVGRDRFVEDGLGGIEKDRFPQWTDSLRSAAGPRASAREEDGRREASELPRTGARSLICQGNRASAIFHGRENLAGSWLEASSGHAPSNFPTTNNLSRSWRMWSVCI